jgi:hypothetical protein
VGKIDECLRFGETVSVTVALEKVEMIQIRKGLDGRKGDWGGFGLLSNGRSWGETVIEL